MTNIANINTITFKYLQKSTKIMEYQTIRIQICCPPVAGKEGSR